MVKEHAIEMKWKQLRLLGTHSTPRTTHQRVPLASFSNETKLLGTKTNEVGVGGSPALSVCYLLMNMNEQRQKKMI